MVIISVSMDEDMVKLLDSLTEDVGLRGRSETIRAAINTFAAEHADRGRDKGLVEGVLLLINDEALSADTDRKRHVHHDLIKTHIHHHLKGGRCLHVFIVSGEAS
ncbi:MAG: ribbon-helix-helix protein, CopG family, partial [Thermoplasmata archaeon]|nr:ribbon-helix-helix protein, CopG family [Thermoplasmata archaeon]